MNLISGRSRRLTKKRAYPWARKKSAYDTLTELVLESYAEAAMRALFDAKPYFSTNVAASQKPLTFVMLTNAYQSLK